MSSQHYQSDSFHFKRDAFYQSLKSKVGLAATKAAALRINLNVEGCGIVAAQVHAPSHAPLGQGVSLCEAMGNVRGGDTHDWRWSRPKGLGWASP